MTPARLYAAAVTPLTAGGTAIDEAAIAPLVRFLLDRGVDGFFVCGTTGEGVLLSAAERKRVAECFRAPGEGRLIIHCGAQSTAETVELARHAARIGADGVAVIPPPYFPLDDAALIEHMVAAAEACSPTPFYLYAFTSRSGYPLTAEVVMAVRERAANVAGIKVSDHSFDEVAPFLALNLPVYIGSEALIPQAFTGGAAGSVSGLASALPEVVAALVREPSAANAARVAALEAALDTTAWCAALKHVLGLRGVPIEQIVRPPLRMLNAVEQAAVERALADTATG